MFELVDPLSDRRGILSHIGRLWGPSVGKYRVNLESISQVGVIALDNAVEEADIIVINEIGPMGLQGKDFQALIKAVEFSKLIHGIIHWRIKSI